MSCNTVHRRTKRYLESRFGKRKTPFAAFSGTVTCALTVLAAAVPTGCSESSPQAPEIREVLLAKGGNGGGGGPGPKVEETDPESAPPGLTLDVRVLGRGFEDGAVVTFLRDLEATGEIVTNSTNFVSDRELVANITIQTDATEDLYDVKVTNPPPRNKDGIGIELFAVTYNPSDGIPASLSLSDQTTGGGIYYPGGSTYTDNVNGDQVELGTGPELRFNLALENNVTNPNTLYLGFAEQLRPGACEAEGSCTADELEADSPVEKSPPGMIVAVDDAGDDLALLAMEVDPGDGSQQKRARLRICFNHPHPEIRKDPRYCVRYQWAGASADGPIATTVREESDYLLITRTAADTWIVSGAGAGAVLTGKIKHKGPEIVQDEGTYHMPVHLTIRCVFAAQCPAP